MILLSYLAISIGMTFPLVLQFSTHIPGDLDAFCHLWLFWWFRYSIFERFVSPFFTDFIFYPNGVNLSLSIVPFSTVFSVPLQGLFGLIPANNLLILLSFLMTAWSTFALTEYLTGCRVGSFVAGVIFAFSRYRFDAMAYGLTGIITTQWLPLFALYFLRALREKSRTDSILAGVFFALVCLSDWYYAVISTFFALALLASHFAGNFRLMPPSSIFIKLATMAITSAVLILPFLCPVLAESLSGNYQQLPRDVYIYFSADPIGFLVPNPQSFTGQAQNVVKAFPEIWRLLRNFYINALKYEYEYTYLGYSALILAFYAVLKVKTKVRFWALCAVLFTILSLGPYLRTLGMTEFTSLRIRVPLPFLILVGVPILNSMVHPYRFIVITILSLAILAAFAVKEILARFARIGLSKKRNLAPLFAGLICLAILLENLSVPIFMAPGTIPPIYESIAREPGDFTILEIPLGSNYDTAGFYDRYQYYQTLHHKRIFGGYVARFPKSTQWFIDGTPVFRNFRYLDAQEDILIQNVSAIGSTVLEYYNVRYVLVHKDLFMWHPDYKKPDTLGRISFLLESMDVHPFFEDEYIKGFKTHEEYEKQTFMRLGENWHEVENWTGVPTRWMENNATLIIVNPSTENLRLDLRARAYGAFQPRSLVVSCNEVQVRSFEITTFPRGIDLEFSILIAPGENVIKFHCPEGVAIPSMLSAWASNKHISIAFQSIQIVRVYARA
jgi:hypothetical protein